MSNSDPKKIINAFPTKDLFISMLIRDLTLRDAIGDLVDNCVDGVRSLSSSRDYHNFWVDIEAHEDRYVIGDNCGGISVATARDYAFRFGRPKNQPLTPGSVGQFGIGMKRALFKLGKKFVISSVASTSKFEMEVDVSEWQDDEETWEFEFKSYEEELDEIPIMDRGTIIIVTDLRSDVKEQFQNENFIKKLYSEIELENLYNIYKGLRIQINKHKLKPRKLELLTSPDFRIAYWKNEYSEKMTVEIFAGISHPSLEDGGWYIFCNDRLVVGPEQTEVTGWTGRKN